MSIKDFPLVSVGIPTFNGEKKIKIMIESILSQTYKNIEIIISDNNSNDKTLFICQNYKSNNPRIKIYKQSNNIGVANNFNFVFNNSRGKYFMWAADDDYYEKKFIESCVKKLEENPNAAMCQSLTNLLIEDHPEIVATVSLQNLLNQNNSIEYYKKVLFNFPATALYGLYNSEFIKKTDLWKNTFSGDLIFIQQLALYGNFVQVDEILFNYVSKKEWKSKNQDFNDIFNNDKMPFFYFPFINIIKGHLRNIIKSKLSISNKILISFILFQYFIYKVFVRILLKVNNYLLPISLKIKLGKLIYWNFIFNKNIKILEYDLFYKRFIKPQIGIK